MTIHKFVPRNKLISPIYNFYFYYTFVDDINMGRKLFYKFCVMLEKIKPKNKLFIADKFYLLTLINYIIRDKKDYEFDYKTSIELK